MKTATVAELHERLDEYLDAVRNGEAVEIRDEKGAVGEIVPSAKPEHKLSPQAERLIAAGVLRAPETLEPLPDDFFTKPRAKFASGSVLEALLEEREEGW